MLRERVAASFDFFIGSFDLRSLKWRFSDQLSITEYMKRYMMTPTDQISTS